MIKGLNEQQAEFFEHIKGTAVRLLEDGERVQSLVICPDLVNQLLVIHQAPIDVAGISPEDATADMQALLSDCAKKYPFFAVVGEMWMRHPQTFEIMCEALCVTLYVDGAQKGVGLMRFKRKQGDTTRVIHGEWVDHDMKEMVVQKGGIFDHEKH